MTRWTKRIAIERMSNNQELAQIYEIYPLARILVESAIKLKRYAGYNRIACHYAYKDWMWAAIGRENSDYWTCIHVIDDLLPPDACDLAKEGESSFATFNPLLPGLPPRPPIPQCRTEKRTERRFQMLTLIDMKERGRLEFQRHQDMQKILQEIEDAQYSIAQ